MLAMTEQLAEKIGKAALAKATELGRPMSVSVVDEAGRLVYCLRQNGAGFFTCDTSRAKAAAAASFRRSTMEITENKDGNPLLWHSLSSVLPAQVLPSPGGAPVFRDGELVGAVGLGGGSPEEDHECALAGAAAAEQG